MKLYFAVVKGEALVPQELYTRKQLIAAVSDLKQIYGRAKAVSSSLFSGRKRALTLKALLLLAAAV
jgi:hypothetical protein